MECFLHILLCSLPLSHLSTIQVSGSRDFFRSTAFLLLFCQFLWTNSLCEGLIERTRDFPGLEPVTLCAPHNKGLVVFTELDEGHTGVKIPEFALLVPP